MEVSATDKTFDDLRERPEKKSVDTKGSERLSDHIIPHILNLDYFFIRIIKNYAKTFFSAIKQNCNTPLLDSKQGLNGAYYGPPILPPAQTYRQQRQCCGGVSGFLGLVVKIILAIIVIVGVATLIAWLVLRPSKLKIRPANASLTQFNVTNGNLLHYNLSVDFNIRNPNKKIGFYFDPLEGRAYYEGVRFGWVPLDSFYLGHKNTTVVRTVFKGQSILPFDNNFQKDENKDSFFITVNLHGKVRLEVGSFKTRKYTANIRCYLTLSTSMTLLQLPDNLCFYHM